MAATQVFRTPSIASTSTSAPPYSPAGTPYELTTFRTSDSGSSAGLPPSYDDSPANTVDPFTGSLGKTGKPFTPTQKLRIDSQGHAACSLPIPPRPHPIPVYDITRDSDVTRFADPLYTSIRQTRGSGTCQLVPGDDANAQPLASTTYRFGPGRPPVITLHGNKSSSTTPAAFSSSSSNASLPEVAEDGDTSFTIKSKSALHRTLIFRTHLGTFTWRYASRAERKITGVNSLVILERIVPVAHAGSSKTTETVVAEVGRFVRSDETRTQGTSKHTAGNGGVLLLDLREWFDTKGEEEEMRRLAVASCISVMKKEIDRRRAQQMITIAAIAGGS